MAVFVLTIETPTRNHPKGREQDITERAVIQQALLAVVSQVSNCGAYSGTISHSGARGEFTYEAEGYER
jgi:hypothetical protein